MSATSSRAQMSRISTASDHSAANGFSTSTCLCICAAATHHLWRLEVGSEMKTASTSFVFKTSLYESQKTSRSMSAGSSHCSSSPRSRDAAA